MANTYELHRHAGMVDYSAWKENGIEEIVFDKDGTLSNANENVLVEEVMQDMEAQGFADMYPRIGVASNNHDAEHVAEFAELVSTRLGVEVLAICRADGYASKPDPEMGLVIAEQFGVTPDRMGVVGDRRLTDVRFSRALGAGATALCDKAGTGDAKWVPTLRILESGIVAVERQRGIAIPGRDY